MLKSASKRGDTLIEVALAIGIFSMTAIAVAAVLSSSTAGAQTALESTLAREEVDTQVDALRFVRNAYAANRNEENNGKFHDVWRSIASHAIELDKLNNEQKRMVLDYAPDSCVNLYSEDALWHNKMFIINPRALSVLNDETDVASVIIDNSIVGRMGQKALRPAVIYPRLVFQDTRAALSEAQQNSIIDDGTDPNLFSAEGIFIVAIRDTESTQLIDERNKAGESHSAFYDFYIRSCWYGSDASYPSAISTVIRLYDPDVL